MLFDTIHLQYTLNFRTEGVSSFGPFGHRQSFFGHSKTKNECESWRPKTINRHHFINYGWLDKSGKEINRRMSMKSYNFGEWNQTEIVVLYVGTWQGISRNIRVCVKK